MLFPVVPSLQQVIKHAVYFYHKFEHFYCLTVWSPQNADHADCRLQTADRADHADRADCAD